MLNIFINNAFIQFSSCFEFTEKILTEINDLGTMIFHHSIHSMTVKLS